jgi:hypothetical protein
MLQLQLFDTYSNLFSSMEQQLHKGQFPLMLFKNITKKRDVRERIFHTTQATFVIELRPDIAQDLKKLARSTTVVRIHPQIILTLLIQIAFTKFCGLFYFIFIFFRGGGAVVYYIVQCINSYARVPRLKVFWLQ